ncbi:MAG: hypothetical protein DMD27_07185 [Gemmatimonadetes bacterium]|nr:MAG: hypothetical protein DMD27_07185 [Gemmatimonadota bacterium]
MSPFSLRVHAAVAPEATTPRVGGGAAVCARAAVCTRLTSAGTRSVRRADTAAMAIPLEAAERAAPISPHRSPERKGGRHTGVNALAPMPQEQPGCNGCEMAPCSTRWPASSPDLPSWRHGPCELERCGVAGSRRRTPAWEEDVKPNGRLLVEGVLALASAGALGCENPVASDRPRPQTAVAVAAADRLPDLAMARLSDLSIRTSNGRRLLRYSTTIVNVGSGPFELHGQRASNAEPEMSVIQRVFDDAGGSRDIATSAVMVYAGDGHNHWHVRDLQLQEVFRADGTSAGRSDKRGFCFWDNVSYRLTLPGAPQSPVYQESGCGDQGSVTTAVGLSIGWGDIYSASLPDQNVNITGLADGRYRLVVTADPGGWFAESDEANNSTWVDFELYRHGKRVRVLGYGPSAMIATR